MVNVMTGRTKVSLLTAAVLAVLALALGIGSAQANTDPVIPESDPLSVTGVYYPDNPTCGDLTPGSIEYKLDMPFNEGTHTSPDGLVVTIARDAGDSLLDWAANVGIDSVFMKAGSGGLLYSYDPEALADLGLLTPEGKQLSHISFCYDRELIVSKTAVGEFTLTHDWSIDKTVTDDALFEGQDTTYTVEVNYDGATESDYFVTGTITVTNPWTIDAIGVAVIDSLASADCGGATVISGGSSLTCTYATGVSQVKADENTAIANAPGFVEASVTVPVSYTATTIVDASVDVDDTMFGALGTVTAPNGATYSQTTSFPDAGSYDNTACVNESSTDEAGDPAENCDTVTVNVYGLEVSKTAETAYHRDHDWAVTKTASDDIVFEGDTVTYTIVAGYLGFADSAHTVSGVVTIVNNHPGEDITVSVDDVVNGTYSALSGASVLVPAGSSANVSYTVGLPAAEDGANVATVTGYKAYTATAPVTFGAPASQTDVTVPVYDTFNGGSPVLLGETDATADTTFTTTHELADAGSYINVACVVEDMDDPDAINCDGEIVKAYGLEVSKTAETAYTTTHDWSIAKTVDEANPFVGQTVEYTVVVSYDGSTDSEHAISGVITITNLNPEDDATVSVSDVVSLSNGDDIPAVSDSITIPAGGTATINYAVPVAGAIDGVNNVDVTLNKTYSASAPVAFASAEVTHVDASVDVDDTMFGSLGTVTAPEGATYTRTRSFDATGAYDNIACVVESATGDEGDTAENCETVTVNVWDTAVSKTAATSFTRTWDWEILKVAEWDNPETGWEPVPDPAIIQLNGTGLTVQYTVTAQTTANTDSDHLVSGVITITNNNPVNDVTVSLSDVLSDGAVAGVPASVLVPAGSSVDVAYAVAPNAVADGTNEASISAYGVEHSASAAYTFTAGAAGVTVNGVNTLVDVTDTNPGFMGITAQADDITGGSKSWIYTDTFTHTGICEPVTYPNTAALLLPGSTTLSVTVNVNIDQRGCDEVLTRTPGYWKTHNDTHPGGARTDETWYLLPNAELTQFFGSQYNWYEVLSLPDGGSPWNTLARHYAAAYMNLLAGTDPADLLGVDLSEDWQNVDVMALAAGLLADPTSLAVVNETGLPNVSLDGDPWTRKELRELDIKGKVVSQYLNSFAPMLLLAEYLDAYNNGYAYGDDPQVGPGHSLD
jgi:hypothetical protein